MNAVDEIPSLDAESRGHQRRTSTSSASSIPELGTAPGRLESSRIQYHRDLEEKRIGLRIEEEIMGRYWITSTIFPLTAATICPIANLMSISALVYPWRLQVSAETGEVIRISDPSWVLGLNGLSLACGVIANLVVLLYLAKRIDHQYAYSQPAAITLTFMAAMLMLVIAIIMGTLLSHGYTHSQAYYYALITIVLYFGIAGMLVINLVGALLGKYPRSFYLTVPHRTLMLQTIGIVLWLCLGGGVFAKLEDWAFIDGIYFCVVSVLTVGFGDILLETAAARALFLIYATVGVIMVGLAISSIRTLVLDRAQKKLKRRLLQKARDAFVSRSSCNGSATGSEGGHARGERDDDRLRYREMRKIQATAQKRHKRVVSVASILYILAFWAVGAAVFMKSENWNYFESIYFAFSSLLTIGYGDFHPVSNAGRPFFVIWALAAVPSLTILVSNIADTIIAFVKDATLWFGEYTILPEIHGRQLRKHHEGRTGPTPLGLPGPRRHAATWSGAEQPKHSTLHHRLAIGLQVLLPRLTSRMTKKLTYDEWKTYRDLFVEVDALQELEKLEGIAGDAHGAGGRDWISEDSPLMATLSETEWVIHGLIARLETALRTAESHPLPRSNV